MYCIYDLEIKKPIPKRGVIVPDIEYCQGWGDKKGMGISVLTAITWNGTFKAIHVFADLPSYPHPKEFEALAADCYVVGYNSKVFDDGVCQAADIQVRTSYDILHEIYRALGLNPFPARFTKKYRGYKLEAVAQATLGQGKTPGIKGAYAPILWQKGRHEEVIAYCTQDTTLEFELFQRIVQFLPLIDPNTGEEIRLRHPCI